VEQKCALSARLLRPQASAAAAFVAHLENPRVPPLPSDTFVLSGRPHQCLPPVPCAWVPCPCPLCVCSVAGLREFCSSGEVPVPDLSRFEDAPPRAPQRGAPPPPLPGLPQSLFRWPWASVSSHGALAAALSGSAGGEGSCGRGKSRAGKGAGLEQPLLKAAESDGAEDNFEECMGETLSDPGSTEVSQGGQ